MRVSSPFLKLPNGPNMALCLYLKNEEVISKVDKCISNSNPRLINTNMKLGVYGKDTSHSSIRQLLTINHHLRQPLDFGSNSFNIYKMYTFIIKSPDNIVIKHETRVHRTHFANFSVNGTNTLHKFRVCKSVHHHTFN
jgi:hypothetical protein